MADLEAWRKQSVATASTGLASSEPDSKPTDFVHAVPTPSLPAIAPASQKAATLDRIAGAAPEQTVAYIESEIETDPKSEASVKAEGGKGKAEASREASARGAVRNGKKPPAKMMAAGFLGALFLLAGVIVIIRNQQGAEVGRVDAPPGTKITPPPGGSVEIQANATTATANSSTSSNPPAKPGPGDVALTRSMR